jgi:DNA-binding CsgD family transcriptional regulator/tetratricopeptide (TPR) repeat protein
MRQKRWSVADVARELERGRKSYKRHAWADAYQALSLADKVVPLAVEDLELLAMSAYMIARDDDYLRSLDRAYHAYLDAGESVRAVRCAFWLGLRLLFRGETGRATGWLARAKRLIECEERDCVEAGYLLLPVVQQLIDAGEWEAAYAAAGNAAEIGDRFGEADLIACARHLQGLVLMQQGQVEQGLRLLDEAMLAVTAGELSPLVTGLIYCSVIDGCQQVYAVDRAREWTTALARWCEAQPEMVSFTGKCLVHRAEIMQLHGAWPEALVEARRGCERFEKGIDPQRPASAFYQLAEIHRLQTLKEITDRFDTGLLGAIAAHAQGAVELAEGDAQAALGLLRRALQGWEQVKAPYMTARTRLLVGLACRALADEEGASLELDAACAVFQQLGAVPDLARLESLTMGPLSAHPHGLTPRELQVLRLIATGRTNKVIAAELFLSQRTVDRHVSNIFTKLTLPSRAAATAYAYEHKLI